jgi:hypothetical protein
MKSYAIRNGVRPTITTAEEGTIGLVAGDKGAIFYNTDTDSLRTWDGTAFQDVGSAASLQAVTDVGNTTTLNIEVASVNSLKLFSQTAVDADNIGIGNNALSSNSGTNAIGIGTDAGRSANSSNTMSIGHFAGYNSTGSNTINIGNSAGYNNNGLGQTVIIGNSAGFLNTGSYLTAVGYKAAYSNDGNTNSAFGEYALETASGQSCVALGAFGQRSASGDYSNSVGNYAMNGSSGDFCNAFGNEAMRTGSGTGVSVFGDEAGYSQTGSYIVGMGYHSIFANTASYAIGIGYFALAANIGQANAIGREVGKYNKGSIDAIGSFAAEYNEGYGVTAIGDWVMRYNSEDNNTALGYRAWSDFYEDVPNAADIANNGTDINGTSFTLTAHGFGNNGEYIVLKYSNAGGSVIGGMTNNQEYQFLIVDANTVQVQPPASVQNQGSGVHTFTPQFLYTNSTAIGANSDPTKSNQVILGDSNVTEVAMGNGDVIYPAGGGTPEGTAVLSTGETVGKVLQADGDNTSSWITLVGITAQQATDITTNNAKISFDSTSSTRLANTSGTNTGDQVIPTNADFVDLLSSQTITGFKFFDTTSGVKAVKFVQENGTSSQYLMADGSVSTGGGSTSLTSTTYTGLLSGVTMTKFRVSKFGSAVSMNVKMTAGSLGSPGTIFFRIPAAYYPEDTVYFTMIGNSTSGNSTVSYFYIDATGYCKMDNNGDAFIDGQTTVSWILYND